MFMFPHFLHDDPAGIEAMQAVPYAMKRIAATAGAAIKNAMKSLRPDILGATLRAMFT